MDIVATLQKKIDSLGPGDYKPGLDAVLLHVQTAFRHLARGQEIGDETAFTDAIYRTNQAFEGSIKEAYRVLEGKDPSHKSPYEIEQKLEADGVFRKRVLNQLTTYRTEWRNPSAHDYKLDFYESEAFLAIVSVTAFACLLLDQISEKLAFNKSKAKAKANLTPRAGVRSTSKQANLKKQVVRALAEYCENHIEKNDIVRFSESQIIGSLHGFLAAVIPDADIQVDVPLGDKGRRHLDLLATRGDEILPIEVKRSFRSDSSNASIAQISKYATLANASDCVLVYCPFDKREMSVDLIVTDGNVQVAVVRPR